MAELHLKHDIDGAPYLQFKFSLKKRAFLEAHLLGGGSLLS